MAVITVKLDGEGCWPDLAGKDLIHLKDDATPLEIAFLPGGMASGAPSVAIRIDLPDGRVVLAETSAKLFLQAAVAIRGRAAMLGFYEGVDY